MAPDHLASTSQHPAMPRVWHGNTAAQHLGNTSATQRLTTPTLSHITTCHDVRAAWRSQRGAGGSGEEQTMLTFATSSGSSSSTSSWPCFSSATGAGGALQEGRSMARVHPRQHTQLAHRPQPRHPRPLPLSPLPAQWQHGEAAPLQPGVKRARCWLDEHRSHLSWQDRHLCHLADLHLPAHAALRTQHWPAAHVWTK